MIVPDDLRDEPLAVRVAALVDAVRGPAAAEELVAEADVVAAMQGLLEETPAESDAAGRGVVRLVGRAVAAKGVATVGLIAFGVAAAAATTGVVATVLPRDDGGPSPSPSTTSPATSVPAADHDGQGVIGPGTGGLDPGGVEDCLVVVCASEGAGAGGPVGDRGRGNGRPAEPPVDGTDPAGQGTGAAPQGPPGSPGGGNGNGNGGGTGDGAAGGNPPVTLPPAGEATPGTPGEPPGQGKGQGQGRSDAAATATPSWTVPAPPDARTTRRPPTG